MANVKDVSAVTDNNSLTINFSDKRSLTILVVDLDIAIQRQAMIHGLKQKLVDAGAISRDPITGGTASIEDKYNAIKEVFDRITGDNPQWNKNRETGTGGSASGGLLLRALIRLYPAKTPDSLKTYVDSKTKSEQAALRANPKIAAIIDTLRAEKTGNIDSDDMLAELEM